MLTGHDEKMFEESGFVIIKGFFSNDEIEQFQGTLRAIIRSFLQRLCDSDTLGNLSGKEFDQGIIELERIDHAHVADVYDTLAYSPAFLRLVSSNKIERAVNQLLDRPAQAPLYGYTNRCRIDPPQDNRRTYGWHQEVFYTIPQTSFLQTWAPLIHRSTPEIGTIEICPGSHRAGIAKQSWNEVPGRALQIIVDDQLVRQYTPQPIIMDVGDLLFFSRFLYHRSGDNVTDKVRYSLVGMYHDIDVPKFRPASINFGFKGQTPKEYYDEYFK